MADDRVQEARERAEAQELVRRVHHARQMISDAEASGIPGYLSAIDRWERVIDDSLQALADRVAELETALRCSHPEEDWTYRDHEGQTWNYCPHCGYAELWADGNVFKQDVLPLAGSAANTPKDTP